MEEKILDKLENWAEPLNKELNLDGTPLWAFYRQMFLTNNFPNRLFNYSVKNLQKSFKKNEIKNKRVTSYLTRKAIASNENIKRNIRKNKIKTKSKKAKILFYAQADKINNGKIKKMGDIPEEVKKQNIGEIFILSYEPIEKNSGLNLSKQDHMIYEYLTKELLEKTREQARNLNNKWEKIPEEKKKSLLNIDGKSLYPFIKEELNFLFSREFLHTFLIYYNAHKKILKEENINLVCSIGAGSFYAKTLYAAANYLKIPTLVTQHGMCFSYIEKDILKNTIFAVFGKKSKEELIDYGISPKNIIITGPAIYDDIIKYKKIKPKTDTITLMTSGFYLYGLIDSKKYFNYIEKWLKELNKLNMDIILKLHPEEKESISNYEEITKRFKRKIKINIGSTKKELYTLLGNSSIVINLGSSVALESIMLEKPVITIMNLHKSAIKDFDMVVNRLLDSDASINIDKNEDLSKAVLTTIKNKEKLNKKGRKFLSDSVYKIDGNASKRTADIIHDLTEIH
jgi:hypothetical protein